MTTLTAPHLYRQARAALAIILALLVVAVFAALPAAAATPNYACPPGVADCTPTVGAWVDVPPIYQVFYGVAVAQVPFCPKGQAPVGFAYNGDITLDTAVNVEFFNSYPNFYNNVGTPVVFFWIVNSTTAVTVQPIVGCAPQTTPPRVGAPSPKSVARIRTWTDVVVPSRGRTYRHRCSAGTHMRESFATIEFLGRRQPSGAAAGSVHVTRTQHRRDVVVTVSSSARIRRPRTVLQTTAFCAQGT